jgi:pimeloyl-ACP methyl ester carboxylesterase
MLKIKFINRGFKNDLVLVSGWATDWRIFHSLDLNYNYISLIEFSPSNFTDGLSQYLKDNSVDKVSMFGWSMGAFLAADFTVKNQNKVKELYLLSIRKKYEPEVLKEIKDKLEKNKTAWLYKFYMDCFSRQDPEGLSWFKKVLLKDYLKGFELLKLYEGLDYLSTAELNTGVLSKAGYLKIFHGIDDAIAPFKEALEIKDKLPNAGFVAMQKTGHALFLSPFFKEIFYG